MKTSNIINLDRRTFFIKFQNMSTNARFIFQDGAELMAIIQNHEKNYLPGIEFIKELDVMDGKFKRVSRADLLRLFDYETEAHLFLSKHYFFKNI